MRRRQQNPVTARVKLSPKSLSERYAEVLRLREAIHQTQAKLSQLKRAQECDRAKGAAELH